MDSKTLVNALKIAVREVIKEELTEILREGLQSTITEMTQPKKPVKISSTKTTKVNPTMISETGKKSKPKFTDSKWAAVLNETEPLVEQTGPSNFMQMMNEGMDEIRMTSRDAQNFGAMRQNMKAAMGLAPEAPQVMEDPETGKVYEVTPEVQQALTRDYSALVQAMSKKKTM